MSPLTALVMDQVEKIKRQGQTVAIIQAKCSEAGKETGIEAQGDYMENAGCADVLVSCLLIRKNLSVVKKAEICLHLVFIKKVVCIVADEAHCIVDW